MFYAYVRQRSMGHEKAVRGGVEACTSKHTRPILECGSSSFAGRIFIPRSVENLFIHRLVVCVCSLPLPRYFLGWLRFLYLRTPPASRSWTLGKRL